MLPSRSQHRPTPNRPTEEVLLTRHCVNLHGHQMSWLAADDSDDPQGRVVVLVHGLAGNANGWLPLMASLGRHARIIAPDLLGHGSSTAPHRGDYSPAGHACRLRDLLELLGHHRVHLVGHSFGGGVAMSFAYQFPDRAASLTLIASGGLGPELGRALRAASLPGVPAAAGVLGALTPRWLARLARHGVLTLGVSGEPELDALERAICMLAAPRQRHALVDTLRGVVNWSGQRVDATDRLHVLASLPCLLIAGRNDRCIPYQHAARAHHVLPDSTLKVLPTGHFPHREQPEQVS